MASEARRGATRIVANYVRLLVSVAMGLVLLPVQLEWLGNDGFGLLMLIGASVGLAAIPQDIMRHSMVRELGAAWHDGQRAQPFSAVYASSFVLCAVVAALTAGIFAVVVAIIPVLRVPDELVAPARWLLGAEGVSTCVLILVSPAFNMYVVTERFVAHNFWTTVRRGAYLFSALVLFLVFRIEEPRLAITLFGISTAALNILLLLIAVGIIVAADRRLRPRPSLATRAALREVSGTYGWNSAVVLAMNLHEGVGAIIMNRVFGLWGNTVYGLGLRLVSYVRMATMGMTFGLDAVSARLSAAADHDRLRSVIRHSTRLHGFVAIPAALAVWLLAEPMLRLWVGRFVQDPDPATGRAVLASAEVIVKIMVIGLACRAIADGWMKIMYGAGHIRRYAPLVLAGGLANPVIALLLIWLLPEPIEYTGAAWGLTTVLLVVHLGAIPVIGARALELSWADMVRPLLRPAIITLVAAIVLLVPLLRTRVDPMGWIEFLLCCSGYMLLYLTLVVTIGLEPAERQRLFSSVRARLTTLAHGEAGRT